MDMTTGSLPGKILLFALPLMLSSLLQLLFNAADIIVVGRFSGPEALAAVGSTTSLINLLVNFFIGLSIGANVVIANYFGAKKPNEISQTLHTAVALSLVSGVFLAIVGFIMAKQFLTWMGSPSDVIELSTLYLQIYFLGMPAIMLYNFGAAILRAVGDTQRPLYYLTVAGVINVVLNLFFVVVLKRSVDGVAIATVVSQCVSTGLLLKALVQGSGALKLDLKQLRIYPDKVRMILTIGLPAGIQGTVFSISNVVIQSSVNAFQSTVIAGNAAAANIEGFVYVSMNAFYQACMTFTGQNVGAGKIDRIGKILLTCVGWATVAGVALGQLCYRLGPALLGIYSTDPGVIKAGLVRFGVIMTTYFLCGIMDVLCGSLRGMGASVVPMAVSIMGACVFRLVWIATYFQAHHTIEVLYWSYPLSWLITLSVHLICFFFVRRKVYRLHGQ